jgi:hypothetical protein
MVTQPELQKNVAALELWNQFQMVAKLSSLNVDPTLDV